MKTYVATPAARQRDWYVVDAEGQTLGRLATRIADALRGKRKPDYTPHIDTGDFVIVVNAEKIHVTGNKLEQKRYWRHSGYPGGIKSRTLGEMLERRPEEVIRKAVKGMLPRNRLARQQLRKLKVYAGPEHPHQAQKPETDGDRDDGRRREQTRLQSEQQDRRRGAQAAEAAGPRRRTRVRALTPRRRCRRRPRSREEADGPDARVRGAAEASEAERRLRTRRRRALAEMPATEARGARGRAPRGDRAEREEPT